MATINQIRSKTFTIYSSRSKLSIRSQSTSTSPTPSSSSLSHSPSPSSSSSSYSSSSSGVSTSNFKNNARPHVIPTSPIFNRREKKKLRINYPRPDKSPKSIYPPPPPMFVNKVTMADGSVIHLTTGSPRPMIALVRDLSNHPLWNPSLAREVADEDQSGRMGRFARRYGNSNLKKEEERVGSEGLKKEEEKERGEEKEKGKKVVLSESNQIEIQRAANKASFEKQGFGTDDLDWMSGETVNSFYGIGNAKNVKGMKKSGGGGSGNATKSKK